MRPLPDIGDVEDEEAVIPEMVLGSMVTPMLVLLRVGNRCSTGKGAGEGADAISSIRVPDQVSARMNASMQG